MINSIKDILVVSDMDGTLLTAKEGIPNCNIETINLFCKLGGRFTVATGRTTESAGRYFDKLHINAPAILYGGGVIYDYNEKKRLKNETLPKDVALRAILVVMEKFPSIGVEIMGDNGRIYVVRSSHYTHYHTYYEKLTYTLSSVDDIQAGWNKVLFACSNETLLQVEEFLSHGDYLGVYFIATNTVYYEIMPSGVSKGNALNELAEYLDIPRENVYAIGDYYNDVELLNAAGHAVAMGNAPDDVKAIADEVTDTCLNGGVGQFIYKLISKYSQ